jgi:hypothetical protein
MQQYDIARSIFYVVRAMPTARQRVRKHIPTTTNTFIAMQHAVNTTTHDVFSMDPP